MKKYWALGGILLIALATFAAGAGTLAWFSDTEKSKGNTFSAASLDLKINGGDCSVHWEISDMVPGEEYFTGFLTLKNVGTIPGNLTVTITNLKCLENGLVEPERAAGDAPHTQLDPDGFSQEEGDGELWDQVLFSLVIDDGDGVYDWQDTKIGLYPDESGYYHIPVDSPIILDDHFEPGEELKIGIWIKFIDDTWTPYSWILDGVPNNAAMTDKIKLDLVFLLEQIH